MEEKKIYFCVSSKYNFAWHHKLYLFRSEELAEKWLHTEESDFREREIMSEKDACKLLGRKYVMKAIKDPKFYYDIYFK